MKRPLFAILDDSSDDCYIIKNSLKRHDLLPEVQTFVRKDLFFNWLNDNVPTAVFVDLWIEGKKDPLDNGVHVLKQFRQSPKQTGATILLTGGAIEQARSVAAGTPYADEICEKMVFTDTDLCKTTLDKLIAKRVFSQPLTVGVYGIGALGMRVVSECLSASTENGKPCVSKVKAISRFWNNPGGKNNYEYLPVIMGRPIKFKDNRLERFMNLEGVFDGLDVFIITTGPYMRGPEGFNPDDVIDRQHLAPLLLKGAADKIEYAYAEMARQDWKKGIILMMTNPVGTLLYRGYKLYPNMKNWLASITPDGQRIRTELYGLEQERIRNILGEDANELYIRGVDIFGDHGCEFGLLDECYLQRSNSGEKYPLTIFNQSFSDPNYRFEKEKVIAGISRSKGLITVKAETLLGWPSEDTRLPIKETLMDLATYQTSLRHSMHCLFDTDAFGLQKKIKGYIQAPVRIDYNSWTVNLNTDYNFKRLHNWEEDILRQLDNQLKLYKSHYANMEGFKL